MVAIVVVTSGVGFLYLSLQAGRVPVGLLATAGMVVLWTLWAILKSVTVRRRRVEQGEPIDLRWHPRLEATLDEVAKRIGTDPVDAVFMRPGTDLAVTEQGGIVAQLRGKRERCLIVGAGILGGLTVRDFKSVLAHEYGHFHNEDTAGGTFALAVRRSLVTMAINLAIRGAATVYNPAWWFVWGFEKLFLRISHGATRLQEILADRWAAFAYGSDAFALALERTVEREVRFDAQIDAAVKELVESEAPVANLYAYTPKTAPEAGELADRVAEVMHAKASPYDSHPPPHERIALVKRLAAPAPPPSEGDDDEAWALFEKREAIEAQMTAEARSRLGQRGIVLKAPALAAGGR
jgi:Zn-dependent protease with chaperone function